MTFSIYNLRMERYRVLPIDGVSMTTINPEYGC
jgi:hypothetical protein